MSASGNAARRRAMSRGRFDAGVVVVAAAAGGLLLDRAFSWLVLAVAVSLAALAPALALLLSAWLGRRRPGPARNLAVAVRLVVRAGSLVLLFVLLCGAAVALLAITLPVPIRPDLLVVPIAFTWIGAALGTELALRAARPGTLVVLLPTAPLWVYGAFFGPATRLDIGAAAVVGGCVGVLLIRSGTGARAGSRLAALAAVGTVIMAAAVVVVVTVALVPLPRSRPRFDPREHLPYVALPQPAVNPVDWVGAWLTDPDRLLFQATTSQTVSQWRLTVLERFDGEQWLPPYRYTRAGLGVPPVGSPAAAGPEGLVRQTVTIYGLPGPFLPSMDRPARIEPPVTAVDVDSGVLVTDRSVRPGFRYTVSSSATAHTFLSHATATAGGAGCPTPGWQVGPDRQVEPGWQADATLAYPAELSGALRELTGTAGCTGSFVSFAQGVEQRLTARRANLARVPPAGTSVGALARFLKRDRGGTPVEFAASFALAVRAAGVPSRLVVGFESPPTAAPATTGHEYAVHGRDVRVWVDVRLPGRGWTAYQLNLPDPVAPPPDRGGVPPPTSPTPSRSGTASSPPSPVPSPSPSTRGGHGLPPVLHEAWVLLPIAAALLVTYLLTVATVMKVRRWVRRHRGPPRRRAVGAWYDVLDELAYLVPREQLRTATPASTRVLIRHRCPDIGTEPEDLTRIAQAAMFAKVEPGEAEVKLAWRAAGTVRRQLRRHMRWYQRLRRLVSVNNLRLRPIWE